MPRVRNRKESEQREAEIREMVKRGMSLNQMAARLDISPQAVFKFMKARGLKTRNASDA